MSGRRDEDANVTIGEVYRLLLDHGHKLDEIDRQVRHTNGRTTVLEQQMIQINRDVKERPSATVVTTDGEALSINARVSPKMWTALAALMASLSIFAPVIAKWVERVFGDVSRRP